MPNVNNKPASIMISQWHGKEYEDRRSYQKSKRDS